MTGGHFLALDLLNSKYINMTKEKRIKNLNSIARRIAEYKYDKEHDEIKKVVTEAAREHDCAPGDIRFALQLEKDSIVMYSESRTNFQKDKAEYEFFEKICNV